MVAREGGVEGGALTFGGVWVAAATAAATAEDGLEDEEAATAAVKTAMAKEEVVGALVGEVWAVAQLTT